jgi:hypothetical protein
LEELQHLATNYLVGNGAIDEGSGALGNFWFWDRFLQVNDVGYNVKEIHDAGRFNSSVVVTQPTRAHDAPGWELHGKEADRA